MIKTVDARSIPCPGPVIEARKALKSMNEGILEILVDNEIAVQNLTKLASYLKLEVTSEKSAEKEYKVTIRVGEGMEISQEINQEVCYPDSRRKGCVVVIASDCMGDGDEVLGRALMKGFVYALTELEHLPETILCYNGGAKLSVEGSESLQDLKLLESQGVEILTCGTCLNHYGLSEKLDVGSVTNMYEIAEKMTEAGSIVRP